MNVRLVNEADYTKVISVVNDWWGRNMVMLLPRLFFSHFKNTSFIIEKDGKLIAFLIGFLSQSCEKEAYIHFIGVHPNYRRSGVARNLYELFFDQVRKAGCDTIRCITSVVNKQSVGFHTKMGFQIEEGDSEINGYSVHSNYDGEGEDRILFVKKL